MGESEKLLQEAIEKGFLDASSIKPGHLNVLGVNCPIVTIPEGSTLEIAEDGSIWLRYKGNSSFNEVGKTFGWVGVVYSKSLKQWAEIITTRKAKVMEDLTGRYIKVIDDTSISHYGVKNGDYLLFNKFENGCEYWGDDKVRGGTGYYFGSHKSFNYFKLMPVGFNPNELSPFDLKKGGIYYLTTDNSVKWYVTNKSENGKTADVGFSVSVNKGFNDKSCYTIETGCMGAVGTAHAYANCLNPKFRALTQDEMVWFRACEKAKKFIPYDEVHQKDFPTLNSFPDSGVCWNTTLELIDYLKNRNSNYNAPPSISCNNGLAWSKTSMWNVATMSYKEKFDISQLQPFFKIDNPMGVVKGDHFTINNPGECTHGIMGIVERVFKNHGVDTVEFQKPLPRHPSGGNIVAVPLSKVVLLSHGSSAKTLEEKPFPKKWCIKGKYQEVIDYSNKYGELPPYTLSDVCYHHYPALPGRCTTSSCIVKDYTEITIEEFRSNILNPFNLPLEFKSSFDLPDKWCIKTDVTNKDSLTKFLQERHEEWQGYSTSWYVSAGGGYFHYPQAYNTPSHTELKPAPGYTEITSEQFIKHVLTHTDKKQVKNNLNLKQNAKTRCSNSENSGKRENCKICRTHLEIRKGSSIRADSFRCSTSKIRLRS